MWTRENRGLYERKGVRYPSDLRDEEWTFIEPLVPPAKRGGRRREADVREVMNGVLYRHFPGDLQVCRDHTPVPPSREQSFLRSQPMAFRSRPTHQNQAIGRLRREDHYNGGAIWV
jgi:hypothetical protein